jgi:rubrerythrin
MPSRLLDRVLDFAVVNEERAAALYHYLADIADQEPMKAVFLCFATEEEMHKSRLLEIKAGTHALECDKRVADPGPAHHLVQPALDLSGRMDYGTALVFAINDEQAAHRLYTNLAEAVPDVACKATLLGLAREEALHRLRFETEYQEHLGRVTQQES